MSFRNKVNEIMKENWSSYEMAVHTTRRNLIEYIRASKVRLKEYGKIEVLFCRDKKNQSNVSMKVFLPGKHTEDFSSSIQTSSLEEVKIVLLFLEQGFKNEYYKILPGTSVQVDECFSVEIDFTNY